MFLLGLCIGVLIGGLAVAGLIIFDIKHHITNEEQEDIYA